MMLSVVIPMYNEESIAKSSMLLLDDFLSGCMENYEIVVSNDGSRDSTLKILQELAGERPNIRVTSYDDNRGKGSAVREGILASLGDVVLYTDCDLAYGTEMIKTISDKLVFTGADVVIGSRNISKDGYEGYTALRKLASKTYIKMISIAAGFRHSDSQSGIKCFTGEAARRIFSKCQVNSFAFDLEALMIAEKLGYRVEEQAVKIINHRQSESKVNLFSDTFKMLGDIKKIKKRIKTIS